VVSWGSENAPLLVEPWVRHPDEGRLRRLHVDAVGKGLPYRREHLSLSKKERSIYLCSRTLSYRLPHSNAASIVLVFLDKWRVAMAKAFTNMEETALLNSRWIVSSSCANVPTLVPTSLLSPTRLEQAAAILSVAMSME